MYARLAFATAIATNPDILLIDEVLAVGDERFQKKCFEKMNEFKKMGKTILFVSHDLKTCELLCDNSLLLKNGEIDILDVTSKVTAKYCKSIFERMKVRGDRWGNQAVVIKNVLLHDGEGDGKHSFKTHDKMGIDIEYVCNSHIENFVVGIAFFSDVGILISSGNTLISNEYLYSTKYADKIRCVIESLPLLNGNYFLSVAITDQTGIVTYDHHSKMYKFSVENSEIQELGLVHINCKWLML